MNSTNQISAEAILAILIFFCGTTAFGSGWSGAGAIDKHGEPYWDPYRGEAMFGFHENFDPDARSLILTLDSEKRTGASYVIELLNAERETLGKIPFVDDWEGENRMHLWLRNFLPRRGNQREQLNMEEVHSVAERLNIRAIRYLRLRLSEDSFAFWEEPVKVGEPELSSDFPRYRVNASDTVIETGWRFHAVNLAEWQVLDKEVAAVASDEVVAMTTPWAQFSFEASEKARVLTLERNLNMPAEKFSKLLSKMTWSPGSTLSVSILSGNGNRIYMLRNSLNPAFRDGFGWLTFAADLEGVDFIKSIRIELRATTEAIKDRSKVGVGLFSIVLREPSVYDDAPWETVAVRLIGDYNPAPEATPIAYRTVQQFPYTVDVEPMTELLPVETLTPKFGFYFDKDDIKWLRQVYQKRDERYLPYLEAIIDEADLQVSNEFVDRNYYGKIWSSGIGHPKGMKGAGLEKALPPVMLAYILTGNREYAEACRRWMLRTARSGEWRGEHYMVTGRDMPGDMNGYSTSYSGWYPKGFAGYMNVGFAISRIGFAMGLGYDVLHELFTEEEGKEITDAMKAHGFYMLYHKLMSNVEFYRSNHQGIWYGLPLVMQLAFFQEDDPVYAEAMDVTIDLMLSSSKVIWSNDGVFTEGPGYGQSGLQLYMDMLPPVSRILDVPFKEIVPQNIEAPLDFMVYSTSTIFKEPKFLSFGDLSSLGWIRPEVLLFYARHLKNETAQYLLDSYFQEGKPGSVVPLRNITLFGDPVPAKEIKIAPTRVFPIRAHAFFRTGLEYGDSVVALTNPSFSGTHSHKDRNSFIFEFNGESLVLDPEVVDYSEPTAVLYKKTNLHNTLIVDREDQRYGEEYFDVGFTDFKSTSGEILPGEPGGIDWVISDAQAVYRDLEHFNRHLVYVRPGAIIVWDHVELTLDKAEMSWNFNFSALGDAVASGYRVETPRNTLHVFVDNLSDFEKSTRRMRTRHSEITAYPHTFSRQFSKGRTQQLFGFLAHPKGDASCTGFSRFETEQLTGLQWEQGEEVGFFAIRKGNASASWQHMGIHSDAEALALTMKGDEILSAIFYGGTFADGVSAEGMTLKVDKLTAFKSAN